jgi:hypothetical protein
MEFDPLVAAGEWFSSGAGAGAAGAHLAITLGWTDRPRATRTLFQIIPCLIATNTNSLDSTPKSDSIPQSGKGGLGWRERVKLINSQKFLT